MPLDSRLAEFSDRGIAERYGLRLKIGSPEKRGSQLWEQVVRRGPMPLDSLALARGTRCSEPTFKLRNDLIGVRDRPPVPRDGGIKSCRRLEVSRRAFRFFEPFELGVRLDRLLLLGRDLRF